MALDCYPATSYGKAPDKLELILSLIGGLSEEEKQKLVAIFVGRREFPFGINSRATFIASKDEVKTAFPDGGLLTEDYNPETLEYTWKFNEKSK